MAVHPREEYTKDEERWIRYGSAPLLATLLLPIIIGVIILLKCVFNHCCVRRTTTKEEMYGLEGRMTMLSTADSSFVTLSDNRHDSHTSSVPVAVEVGAKLKPYSDASQHVKAFGADVPLRSELGKGVAIPGPSSNSSKADPTEAPPCSSSYEDTRHGNIESRRISDTSKLTSSQGSSELSGSLKRASAQHRQLPDLPPTPMMTLCTGARPPRRSSSVLSHDGTSELYATVGETQFPEDPAKSASHYTQIRDKKSGMGKSSNNNSIVDPSLLNAQVAGSSAGGLSVRPRGIEATPSSDSETYASSSSHHPYAKLKKNPASTEHPYARVKAIGANNNDEETDTDNYDLPQFLRGPEGPVPPAAPVPNTSSSMASRPTSSGVSQSVSPSESAVAGSGDISGPVPPRRVGRQWRRSSQPNLQNDNVSNFSGDSQDSRGYTSISVREPLSNIRSQLTANTRSFDSHYATVSDDSEEMYAAIDDPNDANYMRIDQDGQRRPTWLGGPIVSSPIPERREANSPLPPVPPVPNTPLPEPAQSPTTPPIPVPNSPNSIIKNAGLPLYAQVTKKPKKQQPQAKLPVTPTVSNVSTSSSQQIGRESNVAGTSSGDTVLLKENPTASHHNPTHRSKRAASLMDNTNPMDADTVDSRRWSKADISYSEFEVVRESIFPSSSGAPGNNPRSPGPSNREPGVTSSPPLSARQQELLDEDNYNIIPEKTVRGNSSASTAATRNRLDSGNYQIIDHRNVGSTFREIADSIGHSDHYQEINDRRRRDEDDEGGQLYQEIERPTRNLDEDDDEDDDDGDEFYERVKKPPSAAKGKKHGYEKIKKKNIPGNLSGVIPAYLSDEDDEDDERPDELYERVKYPPYERLKESKDDLYDSEDAKSKSDYEDIGYSRVKAKQKAKTQKEQRNRPLENAGQEGGRDGASVVANVEDVSQLYAQVDKSKKRKGSSTCPIPSPKTLVNSNTEVTNSSDNTVHHEIYVNNNEPTSKSSHCTSEPMEGHEHLYSKVAKISKADKAKNKNSGCASEQSCIVNDRNIEYL